MDAAGRLPASRRLLWLAAGLTPFLFAPILPQAGEGSRAESAAGPQPSHPSGAGYAAPGGGPDRTAADESDDSSPGEVSPGAVASVDGAPSR